jgi:geranylgeranyl diphosphate synthase type II
MAVTAGVEPLVEEVERGLAALPLPEEPATLYAPVRYVLDGGGKRVRPVLVLLAAEAFGGEAARRRALPAALAVEVFHNFTLVHDDIMDGASARRGRPTVHVRWDPGTAILAGDLLMGLSYDLLAQVEDADTAALVRRFHRMVLRLCEGQALDAAFERRADVTVPEYLDMVERKTAALLEAALEIGGRIGGAGEAEQAALGVAGRELGRAFQIQDDLLDLTAEHDGWGKAVGGDLVAGKRTFLLLRALERAEGPERAWLARVLDGGLPAADVPQARVTMERLGVLEEARAAVRRHSEAGLRALGALPDGPAAEALRALAADLIGRQH